MGVGFGILKTSGSGGGGGGTTITTVANYSALPLATAVSGKFYWCEASQGTKWLPFSVGGTYYPLGMYYSNGVTWEYSETPYQATLSEVNTGTNTDKFVSPYTFTNADKWSNYTLKTTTISTTSPLQGGGDLSANRTFSIAQANTTTDGYLSSADWNTFSGKQNAFNGYANEIHVSALSGNDTTGNGSLLNPYATITKALSIVGVGQGLIIVHPGTYTESPTSNAVVTIVSINDNASKTFLVGTLTLAQATRVRGIRISNLVITTSGSCYIDDCSVTTSFTKSGNGFVEMNSTTLQCSSGSLISGSGNTIINGDYLFPLVVNNASANVIIKISNSCVAPSVLAGTLAIVDTILVSATPTGNAITSSAGSIVTLANTQVLVPTLDNVARIDLQGFYSIFNVIYDKPNSTLAASSGTGGTTNSIDYFQYINADKFITQGGTSSQFVKGDGTLGTSVSGTVTSVGLTMPTAFTVTNSPITGSGVIAVTGAGLSSQYIRGDGQLATFPTSGGGGSSVVYYLNGSINASVVGYKQLDNTAIIGVGTDISLVGNGLIAQFLTNVANPNRNLIPSGAWNFEMFFSMSSSGGNTKFYVELLKYNGTTFTSIASTIAIPESITGGTTIDLYLTSLAVPETVLLTTDRLAVRVYIVDNSGGRTATLHTEDNHLCQIITTFSGGISSLNGLTANTQYLAVGTSGTDFNISSVTDTHTFNLPTASATNRGALSSTDWIAFNSANFIPKLSALETYRGININNNSTTVVTEGGITMSSSASTTAQTVASTNFATKQIRLRYSATVVSGGRYTGTRGSALLWFIHGGFRFICDFNISDTSYSAGCQQFYGLAGQTTDLAYGTVSGTLVSALTNIVGVGSENGDANLSVFHNDATGTATKVDLGVGFPSNRTVGAISTTVYSIQLYNEPMSTDVKYEVKNNETGSIASGTISTNLPLTSQGLNFFASRCMSVTSVTSTGQFDLSKLGVYSQL